MTDPTWISDEPRLAAVVGRVLSRSRHSRGRVLLVALLATTALVAHRAWKKPFYEATLYFRLEEGAVTDPDRRPPPPRNIREHIASVALSSTQLEQIMRKHGWSQAWLARDREGAIAGFREDISIDVERNYFIFERSAGDAPRSAHVTISLAGSDEARTVAVLRDIGDAILQVQAATHVQYLQEMRGFLGRQLEDVRGRRTSLQRTIEALAAQALTARPPGGIALRGRIAALETELQGAIERETALDRRATEVAFDVSVERAQLGTIFELMDERVATYAPPLTRPRLALRAAFTFAVLLLVTALTVGVFDDRIHAPEDLEWWGLPLFAALPSFPGDDARPLRARADRADRDGGER